MKAFSSNWRMKVSKTLGILTMLIVAIQMIVKWLLNPLIPSKTNKAQLKYTSSDQMMILINKRRKLGSLVQRRTVYSRHSLTWYPLQMTTTPTYNHQKYRILAETIQS